MLRLKTIVLPGGGRVILIPNPTEAVSMPETVLACNKPDGRFKIFPVNISGLEHQLSDEVLEEYGYLKSDEPVNILGNLIGLLTGEKPGDKPTLEDFILEYKRAEEPLRDGVIRYFDENVDCQNVDIKEALKVFSNLL